MNIFKKIKKIFFFLLLSFKGKSICRSYQIYFLKNINLKGKSIDFGTSNIGDTSYNFVNSSQINFISNKFNVKKNNYIKLDLNKKNFTNMYFNNLIVFNVLEHVYDIQNSVNELKKLMKKNSTIFISTPFIYRFHAAPEDFYRFTKNFWIQNLRDNEFRGIKVNNFGTGPFMSCYAMIFDYLKFTVVIPPILLSIAVFFDLILSIFQRTKMSDLYPICIILEAKK